MQNSWTVDSTLASYTFPAVWNSGWIDLQLSGVLGFYIAWRDVALTFYLRKSNDSTTFALPYYEDFTVAYRVRDPAWVDPVLGDPLSAHNVAFMDIGCQYAMLGFSASNWLGANRLLKIKVFRERRVI